MRKCVELSDWHRFFLFLFLFLFLFFLFRCTYSLQKSCSCTSLERNVDLSFWGEKEVSVPSVHFFSLSFCWFVHLTCSILYISPFLAHTVDCLTPVKLDKCTCFVIVSTQLQIGKCTCLSTFYLTPSFLFSSSSKRGISRSACWSACSTVRLVRSRLLLALARSTVV